jgi:ParB/RepB/Spo0J family partition protein
MAVFNLNMAALASGAHAGTGEAFLHPSKLSPSEDQPRTEWQTEQGERWEQFKLNVATRGVEKRIEVIEAGPDGQHRIIEGHRRWRAASESGLQRVPVKIRKRADVNNDALAYYNDNKQREKMHVADDALFLITLAKQEKLSVRSLAERSFNPKSTAENALACRDLPVEVFQKLRKIDGLSFSALARFAAWHKDASAAAISSLDENAGTISWPLQDAKTAIWLGLNVAQGGDATEPPELARREHGAAAKKLPPKKRTSMAKTAFDDKEITVMAIQRLIDGNLLEEKEKEAIKRFFVTIEVYL